MPGWFPRMPCAGASQHHLASDTVIQGTPWAGGNEGGPPTAHSNISSLCPHTPFCMSFLGPGCLETMLLSPGSLQTTPHSTEPHHFSPSLPPGQDQLLYIRNKRSRRGTPASVASLPRPPSRVSWRQFWILCLCQDTCHLPIVVSFSVTSGPYLTHQTTAFSFLTCPLSREIWKSLLCISSASVVFLWP